jgi:CRP/FNR family transcriptional regulator
VAVRAEFVSSLSWTNKLARGTLQRFVATACLVACPSGETFYRQGDPPTGLYILQSGRVKLCRQSRERKQILALLMPGDWFGAESLPTDSPSPLTAIGLTPTEAIYVSPHDLRDLLAHNPDFQETLIAVTAQRLKQLVSLVHDLAFRDVASRLAAVLVTRAQLEGRPTQYGVCIDRLLSQQEFAEMIGTAREVINRTFKRFEQAGILQLAPQSILILDLDLLTEIAQQETS